MEYVRIYGFGSEKVTQKKEPKKQEGFEFRIKVETFNSEELGYKQITTFFQDFSIADRFGVEAVRDTYDRSFKGWKNNCQYFTELVMVLNWKLAIHYERGNKALANVYDELWRKADAYALDHFEGEDLQYFLDTVS